MNLKRIICSTALGIGSVVVAPVAIGAVATGAFAIGAVGTGVALTTAAVDLTLVSTGTAAAIGAGIGAISSAVEEKNVEKARKQGTKETAQVYEEKFKVEKSKIETEINDYKRDMEEQLRIKNEIISEQENVINAFDEK